MAKTTQKRKATGKTKRQEAAAILGKSGGLARAKNLSPARRQEISRRAGLARQGKPMPPLSPS